MTENIIVTLHGRLGNQLFEFAVGDALAHRTRGRPCFCAAVRRAVAGSPLAQAIGRRLVPATGREFTCVRLYDFATPPRRTLARLARSDLGAAWLRSGPPPHDASEHGPRGATVSNGCVAITVFGQLAQRAYGRYARGLRMVLGDLCTGP